MTYEEVLAEAKRIWGTLDWSEEQGWFVTGGYPEAAGTSWWQLTGQGGLIRDGEAIYPQISWAAQQQLEKIGMSLPSGFTRVPAAYEEAVAQEADVAYTMYVAQGGTLSKEEWIAADKPAVPGVEEFQPAVTWDMITDPDTGMVVLAGYDEEGKIVSYEPSGFGRQEPATWEQTWQQEQEFEAAQQTELIDWYREQQTTQLGAEKQQRLAQLAAQPMSWLQYAAESGTTPVIQPWMLPLMSEQYSQFGVGQPIPGYQGIEGTAGQPAVTPTPTTPTVAPTTPAGTQAELPATATPPGQLAQLGGPPNYPFQTLPMPPAATPFGAAPAGYTPMTAAEIFPGGVPAGFNPQSVYYKIPSDVLSQLREESAAVGVAFPANLQYLQGGPGGLRLPHVGPIPESHPFYGRGGVVSSFETIPWADAPALTPTPTPTPTVTPTATPTPTTQPTAGTAIAGQPAWTGDFTGMPQLLRPSAQYQARMGPTALEQYYGYQQARTGATPEETQFRRWSTAPPSGYFAGLRYRS